MKTRASFRLFRTGLIGSVVLGLAVGGHLAGGGELPEPAILAALCALTLVPIAILTRFRLSWPVLAGLVGAGQLWLHWSFCTLSGAPTVGDSAAPLLSGHAGHSPAASAAESLHAALPAHGVDDSGLMFAAHALATFGTALLLARGEKALCAMASWLRPLVRLPEPSPVRITRLQGPFIAPSVLHFRNVGLSLPSRRGPPASSYAA
ncbi:hypothetical protein AB6813_17360 [bacterium RCC_150]